MVTIQPWYGKASLTGATRVRLQRRLFRRPLLVLQVEFELPKWITTSFQLPDKVPESEFYWRDAVAEDFLNHGITLTRSNK